MAVEVMRRDDWDGVARELGHLFRLHKQSGERPLEAVCRLMSHPLGCELRLEVAGNLHRSEAAAPRTKCSTCPTSGRRP